MEAQLRDEMNAMSNPTLAPYAKEGSVSCGSPPRPPPRRRPRPSSSPR